MHTGAIFGIEDARHEGDTLILKDFINTHKPLQPSMTENQMLIDLAGSFSYLVEDLVVRVLGLGWEDLGFNLNPPSRKVYFDGRKDTE